MKRPCFVVFVLIFSAVCLFTNRGLAQDYKHHATLTGHTGSVWCVAFSPNRRTLASGSSDRTIRLWDVQTGRLINTLTGHTGWVGSIAFSPDGQMLASGSWDNTIRLWDVQTGRLINTLPGHTDGVGSIAFSPDGQMLASGSLDNTIRLWNAAKGKLKNTLTRHPNPVIDVVFSPDGQILASGSTDSTIYLWDVQTGTWMGSLRDVLTGHTHVVRSIAFSPDGQTLASRHDVEIKELKFNFSRRYTPIYLWNVQTRRLINTLTDWSGSETIAFGPDGKTLASESSDNTIRLWDVQTGRLINTLTGHTGLVESIAFGPDGLTFATATINIDQSDQSSKGGLIRLWKISTQRSERVVNLPSLQQSSAELTYDTAIRAVMWISIPGVGTGSGMLIDKRFKLAVTNAHVTDTQSSVGVYFPAPDENGEPIKDRDFYVENREVLKRLGYYTRGHIVARNAETDLAIIKLEGLPETAREIEWDFKGSGAKEGDIVYILGNPGGQELWRWTLGEYLGGTEDFLHIQSDVFGGNSGGPVLNKQGTLLGIVARSDSHINAYAIPVRKVSQLLSESGLKHSRTR